MKTLETTKQTEVTEKEYSVDSLEFADVVVYNEMADQTSVKMNLIEQIHAQLNQIEEMTHKRQFMMKEVLQHIID
ncbi:hypothetical protein K2P97_09755 [bacterium]|nr:hypothetical protein [bacterium]